MGRTGQSLFCASVTARYLVHGSQGLARLFLSWLAGLVQVFSQEAPGSHPPFHKSQMDKRGALTSWRRQPSPQASPSTREAPAEQGEDL